jgi:ATP-binding cassette subfamily B protein/subfamily B ATP-binding cassette protein MsbA
VTGDCWSVHTVVDELVFTPLHATITTVGIVVVMVELNGQLTLISVLVAPLMAVASVLFGKPTRRAARRRRKAEIDIQSHVQQTLAGMSVVQAFGQEERARRRFQDLASSAISAEMRGTITSAFNLLSSGLIGTLGMAVVLLVGARAVIHGSLTTGGLLVFVAYVTTLQGELTGLAGIYTKLQGARAGIDRVLEVLDAVPEVVDRPGARVLGGVRGSVSLEGVVFGYEPGRPVLEGVSLRARPGEVVAVVGATGAGKSTLVSLVPRFFDPWSGSVRIDGVDVRELRLASVREQVALVLQDSFLFPLTVAENIAYGRPDASRAEIVAAAQAANAHAFVERLPDGYDSVIGERGATLSGGERQRLAIARALLKDAPILILDEPTSALDSETEALLLNALERLMNGRTTLIVAHRLSTIRHADRIVVLTNGHITETGNHHQLLQQNGTYARLHGVGTLAGGVR